MNSGGSKELKSNVNIFRLILKNVKEFMTNFKECHTIFREFQIIFAEFQRVHCEFSRIQKIQGSFLKFNYEFQTINVE